MKLPCWSHPVSCLLALLPPVVNLSVVPQSISPGLVETEFVMSAGFSEEESKKIYSSMPCIQADDITETLVHVLSAPPHVQVGLMHRESHSNLLPLILE